MSRSFKKHPGYHDGEGSKYPKFAKRFANSRVRHYRDLANGGMYKKVFDSYGIHDYNFRNWTRAVLVPFGWPGRPKLQPWPCYKELCKTEEYRKARMK
jgi:hypothetical protein